ncbi:hypothetical protein D3C84_607600 [compost metagenome]
MAGTVFRACKAGDGIGILGDVAHVFPVGNAQVVRRQCTFNQVGAFFTALGFAIPEHHFVFPSEQRVGPRHVEVISLHFLRPEHVAQVGGHAAAVLVREAATAVIQLAVGIAFAVGVGRFEMPAGAQLLLQRGECCLVLDRPGTPGRGHIGGASQVCFASVGIPVRQGAIGGALHVFVLIVVTHGQHGVVGQIGFENAVTDFPLLLILVAERIGIAIGQHAATPQPAVKGQRAADIQVAVVVVVAATADTGLDLPLRCRSLAHHVDGGRRVARTRGQAGRTANHFDAVVDDGVRVGLHVAEGIEHAIDLEIADRVAAGGIADPVRVVVLDHYAGGLAHGFGQRAELEVVHLLTGDHGHRLRRFLDRQVQAGGGAHGAGGVRLGVFGGAAQALGRDAGGTEYQGGGLFVRVGFSQQVRA